VIYDEILVTIVFTNSWCVFWDIRFGLFRNLFWGKFGISASAFCGLLSAGQK
jgi:hypothetical protein